MHHYKYNDYELIYLIQSYNDEISLKIMFDKYMGLIYKYIYLYSVPEQDKEDFIQEAKILMYKIIKRFDERKNKTFTRFYELVLKRKFIELLRKKPKYEIYGDLTTFKEIAVYDYNLEIPNTLTEMEKEVLERYFIKNQKISFIQEEMQLKTKQVYNAIYRIKEKYKLWYNK